MESNKSKARIATGVICWSTTFVMGAMTLKESRLRTLLKKGKMHMAWQRGRILSAFR